jgi:hypothetical protein
MTAHREYLERVIEAAEKFAATAVRLRQEMDEAWVLYRDEADSASAVYEAQRALVSQEGT